MTMSAVADDKYRTAKKMPRMQSIDMNSSGKVRPKQFQSESKVRMSVLQVETEVLDGNDIEEKSLEIDERFARA